MRKVPVLVLSATLLPVLAACSDFETRTVNGVEVLVLKDINKAFPAYASDLKIEVELAAKSVGKIADITAKGGFGRETKSLRDSLDQINSQAQEQLKAAYLGYVTGLAGELSAAERAKRAEAYERFLMNMSAMATELRKLNIEAGKAAANSSSAQVEALLDQGKLVQNAARALGVEFR